MCSQKSKYLKLTPKVSSQCKDRVSLSRKLCFSSVFKLWSSDSPNQACAVDFLNTLTLGSPVLQVPQGGERDTGVSVGILGSIGISSLHLLGYILKFGKGGM